MASDQTLAAPRRATGAWVLAGFVVAVVGMMIVPIPTWLLDALLTFNLALSVSLLLAAVYSARTLELSTFPTLLVLTTLFRLSLNVSTVRLILSQANAGRVVHSFGAFVVRGDYVVGFAVFLILTLVQYIVISRGAERVAEVAARFTLDAMPGMQLAIDAELRSGVIDAAQARDKRAQLTREAQLYGALDGAMRFVRGDAIAALCILGISLVGGLTIGVVQHGLPLGQAARVYTLLTIGDGLVSQLPALLISTAAGLVVTRVASDQTGSSLGRDLSQQLLRPRALLMTALLLALLAIVPGLPLWPFAGVGAGALALALWARRNQPEAALPVEAAIPERAPDVAIALDPQLVQAMPDAAARAAQVARRIAEELGIPLAVPEIRVDASLPRRTWELRLRGVPHKRGAIPDGRLLAAAGPASLPAGTDADPAEHPSTGALASWVPRAQAEALRKAGVALYDGADILAAALEAMLRTETPALLGVDETQALVDALARRHPALVRETVPKRIELPALAELLRRLVGEGLPIGDLRDVLEAVAQSKSETAPTDMGIRAEHVRAQLSRRISHRFATDGKIATLELDGEAEEAVRGALRETAAGSRLALEPDFAESLLASLRQELEAHPDAALLTSGELRRHLRRLVADEHPRLPVLAYHELAADVEVERVGTVRLL
jgi:type III secretion protein V